MNWIKYNGEPIPTFVNMIFYLKEPDKNGKYLQYGYYAKDINILSDGSEEEFYLFCNSETDEDYEPCKVSHYFFPTNPNDETTIADTDWYEVWNTKWISCAEKMPLEKYKPYLILYKGSAIAHCYLFENGWKMILMDEIISFTDVTHWMRVPLSPVNCYHYIDR